MHWIDSHCHLDAAEFDCDRDLLRQQARQAGVLHCVLPAVQAANWPRLRQLAQRYQDSYALGLHPLYVASATETELLALERELTQQKCAAHLVAIGEIGLDGAPNAPPAARQEQFYRAQLRLARRFDLPVLLHGRGALDRLLKGLRELPVMGGIVHAFNGSWQQAQAFMALGFKLGFGGAVTFERARQLRSIAVKVPPEALVLETDAPDMPPCWRYVAAQERAQGQPAGRNTPADLVRIAQVLADLRGMTLSELATISSANAYAALPRLRLLV